MSIEKTRLAVGGLRELFLSRPLRSFLAELRR